MLKVLWETGCRNDTLLNLKYKDLKIDDMMVFLKGKRGDERYVSMEKDLFNELYNWV
jgi:site-specific recombinase XerD